jgi:hypothetical protein
VRGLGNHSGHYLEGRDKGCRHKPKEEENSEGEGEEGRWMRVRRDSATTESSDCKDAASEKKVQISSQMQHLRTCS